MQTPAEIFLSLNGQKKSSFDLCRSCRVDIRLSINLNLMIINEMSACYFMTLDLEKQHALHCNAFACFMLHLSVEYTIYFTELGHIKVMNLSILIRYATYVG